MICCPMRSPHHPEQMANPHHVAPRPVEALLRCLQLIGLAKSFVLHGLCPDWSRSCFTRMHRVRVIMRRGPSSVLIAFHIYSSGQRNVHQKCGIVAKHGTVVPMIKGPRGSNDADEGLNSKSSCPHYVVHATHQMFQIDHPPSTVHKDLMHEQ